MEHAIELAKELLTFEYPENLTKKEQKAKDLECIMNHERFEMYCYLHNFNTERIKDMASEQLKKSNDNT